jgi:hypothetical protein
MAAEAASPLQLTQTAAYSIGITPGNATWTLQSSVAVAAAYAAGEVHMFLGDAMVRTSRPGGALKEKVAVTSSMSCHTELNGRCSCGRNWQRAAAGIQPADTNSTACNAQKPASRQDLHNKLVGLY